MLGGGDERAVEEDRTYGQRHEKIVVQLRRRAQENSSDSGKANLLILPPPACCWEGGTWRLTTTLEFPDVRQMSWLCTTKISNF